MKESFKNNNSSRSGGIDLSKGISNALEAMGATKEILLKARRASQVKELFIECINEVYGQAAYLIFDKTNAVYLLHEPRNNTYKAFNSDKDKVYRLLIYTCDSMVHADLDARQEEIKRCFMKRKQKIDSYELLSSKFEMRKRFPFKDLDDSKRCPVYRPTVSINSKQKQETLKEVCKIENSNLRNCLHKIVNN